MKKARVWIVIVFVAVLVAAAVNVNLTYNAANDDEFSLRNVEALAQGEGGDGECWGSGDITCPDGKKYAIKIFR